MSEKDLLKRLQLLKLRPDLAKELTPTELADLVVVVLEYVKQVHQAVEAGKVRGPKGEDAYNPVPDKDYMALDTAQAKIDAAVARMKADVQKRLDNIRDGKDGEDALVTDEHIEKAAAIAAQLIQLPDYRALITKEPAAIRDALELLQGQDRLKYTALDGLQEVLEELGNRVTGIKTAIVGKQILRALNDVSAENPTNGQALVWNEAQKKWVPGSVAGGSGAWGDITGTLSDQTDLQTALDGKADALGADDNYVTDAEKTKLSNLSGTNTGDQTSIVGISGTKAQFDTALSDGNFLYVGDVTTNATHTGEVTGSGALTVDKTAITGKTEVTAEGTDYVLISDTSDSGNLKKALVSDISSGSGISESLAIAYAIAL